VKKASGLMPAELGLTGCDSSTASTSAEGVEGPTYEGTPAPTRAPAPAPAPAPPGSVLTPAPVPTETDASGTATGAAGKRAAVAVGAATALTGRRGPIAVPSGWCDVAVTSPRRIDARSAASRSDGAAGAGPHVGCADAPVPAAPAAPAQRAEWAWTAQKEGKMGIRALFCSAARCAAGSQSKALRGRRGASTDEAWEDCEKGDAAGSCLDGAAVAARAEKKSSSESWSVLGEAARGGTGDDAPTGPPVAWTKKSKLVTGFCPATACVLDMEHGG
jgi:hypothetical protein